MRDTQIHFGAGRISQVLIIDTNEARPGLDDSGDRIFVSIEGVQYFGTVMRAGELLVACLQA